MAKQSQHSKILKMLREAGTTGVPNHVFAKRASILSYPKRLSELRSEGHKILKQRQYINDKATGVFNYILIEDRPKKKFKLFGRR